VRVTSCHIAASCADKGAPVTPLRVIWSPVNTSGPTNGGTFVGDSDGTDSVGDSVAAGTVGDIVVTTGAVTGESVVGGCVVATGEEVVGLDDGWSDSSSGVG